MLRPLKTSQVGTRLLPFKTTTGAANALTIGKQHFSIGTGFNTSQFTPTYAHAARRESVALATGLDDAADGGAVVYNSGAAVSSATQPGSFYSTESDATPDAGVGINGLCVLGDYPYENVDGSLPKVRYDVTTPHPGVSVVPFYVTGGGSPVLTVGSSYGSVAYLWTGSEAHFTVTFNTPFGSDDVIAVATGVENERRVRVESIDKSSVTISTWNSSGGATNADFMLLVYGTARKNGLDSHRNSLVQCPLLSPRLCTFAFDSSVGTALDVGAKDGAVTDQGSNVYRITFSKPYGMTPVVVVGGELPAIVEAVTTTYVDVSQHNAAAAEQDGAFKVIVIGSDAAYEVQ